MPLTAASRLRSLLGEEIPPGGADTDTRFTDEKIEDLLARFGGNLDAAAYEGWRIKAGIFANLVDVADGNSQRAMSDLRDHAERQMKIYERSGGTPAGRTRIGKIRRAQ